MTSGHSVPEQTVRRNIVHLVVVMEEKHTKGRVFELHHCERTPVLSTRVPAWWLLGLQGSIRERPHVWADERLEREGGLGLQK